jgi:hypothetical protein
MTKDIVTICAGLLVLGFVSWTLSFCFVSAFAVPGCRKQASRLDGFRRPSRGQKHTEQSGNHFRERPFE